MSKNKNKTRKNNRFILQSNLYDQDYALVVVNKLTKRGIPHLDISLTDREGATAFDLQRHAEQYLKSFPASARLEFQVVPNKV